MFGHPFIFLFKECLSKEIWFFTDEKKEPPITWIACESLKYHLPALCSIFSRGLNVLSIYSIYWFFIIYYYHFLTFVCRNDVNRKSLLEWMARGMTRASDKLIISLLLRRNIYLGINSLNETHTFLKKRKLWDKIYSKKK